MYTLKLEEENSRLVGHLFNMLWQAHVLSKIEYQYCMEPIGDGTTAGWTVRAEVRVGGYHTNKVRTYVRFISDPQKRKSDARRKAMLSLASLLPVFCRTEGVSLSHEGLPIDIPGRGLCVP